MQAANARLDAVLSDVRAGTYRQLEAITFPEFAEKWLEVYARPNVKPSTHADYSNAVRVHLVPWFGDQLLTSIQSQHIQAYLAEKVAARNDKGEPKWSPKTINNTLVPLRVMLRHAVEWGHLAVSPANGVRPIRREVPEREVLAPDEIAAVLDVADEPWRVLFRAAFLTGLRRGELLGLRWEDVELDRSRLHVRQVYGRYGVSTPKSKAGRRVVPLTPGLVRELKRHKLAQPPSELVFASVRGDGPIPLPTLKKAWARTLRKAGLRHVPFHSTRHTAVSLMIGQEHLNPKQLQTVIGHASIQLTFDTYGHLMPDAFDGFGSGLDGALGVTAGVTAGATAASGDANIRP